MKRVLTYLLQQEKLTIFVGVLLGFVFVAFVEVHWGSTVVLHAQSNEGIESKVSEVVDLEENNELDSEEALTPRLSSDLVEEDTLIDIDNTANGVSGGVEILTMTIVEESDETDETNKEKAEEILDATGVPNEEEGCKSWNFTYMAYTKVTSETSDQYNFLYNEDLCYTDPMTGIRMSDGRYCIAVGSFYSTQIGQKIDLLLTNGTVLKCVLGDCKADVHTDATHRYHAIDGSVAEFVVDYDYFNDTSQWSDLNLTTIEEVRIVAEDGDDVELVRQQIAKHKEEVEQKRLAREAELESLAALQIQDLDNIDTLAENVEVSSEETAETVVPMPTEITPEMLLALTAMNMQNTEGMVTE